MEKNLKKINIVYSVYDECICCKSFWKRKIDIILLSFSKNKNYLLNFILLKFSKLFMDIL